MRLFFYFFFFNDTATTEIYTTVHTLSLHDALPISPAACRLSACPASTAGCCWPANRARRTSGSSVRSEEHTSELQSRTVISYAVFCLKKKKKKKKNRKKTYNEKKKKNKKKKEKK